MKKQLLLTRMLLLVALLVGSVSAWGQTTYYLEKVTSVSAGEKYVFEQDGHVMNNTVSSSALQTTDTYSTTGLAGTESYVWTLETATGGFYLKNVSKKTEQYLNNASSTTVAFGTKNSIWTFSFTNGIALIQNSSNSNRFLGYTTASSYVYKAYATGNLSTYPHAITVYRLVEAPSYTITAESNNDTYGTVSSVGNIITGSPKSGCRYASPAYTVVSGSATVAQEGNTFTVTTSVDCTIRINFEEIPSHTLAYAVSPVGAGNITLSATSIKEGATATATAVANAGYKFTSWSISGDGATLSSTSTNPTTVTMGTADATVTANFEAIVDYPIHWSVNNKIVRTDNVEENTAISFPSSIDGIPAGFVLKGWVTEANKIDTPTDTDPSANYVTSATSTAEITYYAVMAAGHEEETTGELKDTDIYEFESHGYNDDEESKTIDGIDWTFRGSRGDNPWMQIRSNATASYIMMEADGPISSVYLQISNASNSSGGANDISKHGDFTGTVYLESEYQSSPSGALGKSTVPAGDKEVTINVSPSNSTVVIQASGACRIWDVKATYTVTSYSNYCTTIPTTVPVTISDAKYATFSSPYRLNFEGSDVKAYKAISTGDASVTLEEMTVVDANVGVLLHAETADTYNIPTTSAAATSASDNLLVSTAFASYTVTGKESGTAYVFGKLDKEVGFFKAATGKTIGIGKSWLLVPGTGAKDVEFLSFVFGDEESETTGIRAVVNEQAREGVYDLQGRKVTNPTKGLYIVNGKKVIIK